MFEQTKTSKAFQMREFCTFKENVDSWIKEFNHKMSTLAIITQTVDENMNNTNHNYEMLQSLQREIDGLRQEVKTMKLMQLLVLKKAMDEEKA